MIQIRRENGSSCLPHKFFNGLKEEKSSLNNPKEIPLHLETCFGTNPECLGLGIFCVSIFLSVCLAKTNAH